MIAIVSNKKMAYPIFIVFVIYAIGVLTYYLVWFLEMEESRKLWSLTSIIIATYYFIAKNNIQINRSLRIYKFYKRVFYYIYFLAILFFVVNCYQVSSIDYEKISENYIKNSFLFLGIYFPLVSIAEELIYRGFLLNYLDTKFYKTYWGLSIGNLIASAVMTLAHFCYFFIFPIYNSYLALLVVFGTSLIMGIIYTKTDQNLLVCTLVHLLLSYVHFSVYCLAYL